MCLLLHAHRFRFIERLELGLADPPRLGHLRRVPKIHIDSRRIADSCIPQCSSAEIAPVGRRHVPPQPRRGAALCLCRSKRAAVQTVCSVRCGRECGCVAVREAAQSASKHSLRASVLPRHDWHPLRSEEAVPLVQISRALLAHDPRDKGECRVRCRICRWVRSRRSTRVRS
eukprot:5497587-Pleurochrysis_carterae.AAC.3